MNIGWRAETDYDLAILGGDMSSRIAAYVAAQRGARVALIAPNWQIVDAAHHTWQFLCRFDLTSGAGGLSLGDWVKNQCDRTALSPASLNSQGVDVILEPADFTQELRLNLENRFLKASRYLLTDGYGMTGSPVPGGLLCHQLAQLEKLPEQVAVVGHGATVVEWAYAISRSATVTLVLLDQTLLPAEDQDIQRLVAAQLESLGIKIIFVHSHAEIHGIRETLKVDRWVVVPQPHTCKTLTLENIGINPKVPLTVDPYLQTCCPQLYVSGGTLGGENRPELTQQETRIALDNALLGRRRVMHYEQIFYGVHLLSPVGRWGLTEAQAKQRYGQDIRIFQGSCLPEVAHHAAQINFCKLITLGQWIIGVHLMGEGAPGLVATLRKRPRMQLLSQWATASFQSGSLQSAVYQAIAQWQNSRWCPGQWRRDWAENWFNLRRSL